MHIKYFDIEPNIPEPLDFLEELAYNMWWCWNQDAEGIFQRLDSALWEKAKKNPFYLLDRVPQERFNELAKDEAYLAQLNKVQDRFRQEVCYGDCDVTAHGKRDIAYFCLEYGVHASIRLYSGGLGILAGDHLKSASDHNASFAAVGLLYRQGYFEQYLDQGGWQQEHYPENILHDMPAREARDSNKNPITVTVPFPEGRLKAAVYVVWVGNIPLYLLDTNIPANSEEFREITARLYGGGTRTRLRQELLLAIGGFRALIKMGYEPSVCHMNEGHAAFLSLARIEHLTHQKGLSYEQAIEIVRRSNVFTTHTPVAAGNEWFNTELVREHLEALQEETGINPDNVLGWGMPSPEKKDEICNTILALRMSHCSNAVSRLHGQVTRNMWAHLWKELPRDEVPIDSITNGVHAPSWVSEEQQLLFNRYLGPGWLKMPCKMADSVNNIPDEELWRAHEFAHTRLIRTARERLEQQYRARNAPESEIERVKKGLQDNVLTIGFARRFTAYKRADLLLQELERFKGMLANEERPVQFIFAGKAHPADEKGKELIRRLVNFKKEEGIGRRLVFLEDYDMILARQLVQGVDVWLNTPRRPLEASGTSGMKACLNGALHLSILDGWWAEGYLPECGWVIGDGREYEDINYQDMVEARALFNLLEEEIIPLYYKRSQNAIPEEWIKKSKAGIRHTLKNFSSHRMLVEYDEKYYKKARDQYRKLTDRNGEEAQKIVEQRKRYLKHWERITLDHLEIDRDISRLKAGDTFEVTVDVDLGELQPVEVEVHVYYGPVDSHENIYKSNYQIMKKISDLKSGKHRYRQELSCQQTGRCGLTCRVVPCKDDWRRDMSGFITWA